MLVETMRQQFVNLCKINVTEVNFFSLNNGNKIDIGSVTGTLLDNAENLGGGMYVESKNPPVVKKDIDVLLLGKRSNNKWKYADNLAKEVNLTADEFNAIIEQVKSKAMNYLVGNLKMVQREIKKIVCLLCILCNI